MLNRDTIILEHVITEKATEATSLANQYTFKVAREANRVSVKQAGAVVTLSYKTGGKNSGQQRAQHASHAVNPEGVERIIIAKRVL